MYGRGATDRTGRRVTFSPVPETRNGFRVGGSRWRLRPRPFWRGTVGHRPFLDNVFHGGSRFETGGGLLHPQMIGRLQLASLLVERQSTSYPRRSSALSS